MGEDNKSSSQNTKRIKFPTSIKPENVLEETEIDTLDTFMAELNNEIAENTLKISEKGTREDITNEDEHEEYIRFMDEHRMDKTEDDDCQYLFDDEGTVIGKACKELIEPLPSIDHESVRYLEFKRNFYSEAQDIAKLTEDEVAGLRKKLQVTVSGIDPPKPVTSFSHFAFHGPLLECIRKSGFTIPTAIQSQGIPAVLSGRDVIGIAKTGSGKTLAFILPMVVHIIDQEPLKPNQGPIALIVCPTRELAQQITVEAMKYGKPYRLRILCAFGGGNMWEQQKACQYGVEVLVCTPGRLIDLVKKKSTNFQRVTFLVFDEADRLFELGFEAQIRSIARNVRPDRQTLFFSATFRWKTEKLARDVLTDPVRVVHGETAGEINQDISQIVDLICSEEAKWDWLRLRIVSFMSVGTVLIFVNKKQTCVDLLGKLSLNHGEVCALHGDLTQFERNDIITGFKNRKYNVMVATDVAARGLDIPHIRTVINYDPAKNMDIHTHRCGRTGRAGEKGTAYTLLTSKDKEFAGLLVRQLEATNQFVLKGVLDLANKNPWFQKNRHKYTKKAQPSCDEPRINPQTQFKDIKSAMMAKYKSRFVPAASHPTEENTTSTIDSKKVKKTRWSN